MTEAEYAIEKRRVRACLDHWLYRLGMMCQWRVNVEWKRGAAEAGEDGKDRVVVFDVSVDWEYQRAYMRCWLDHSATDSDDELAACIRHELLHVLVNEMREYRYYDGRTDAIKSYHRHEERVVCQLETALRYVVSDDGQARYPFPPPEWSPFDV